MAYSQLNESSVVDYLHANPELAKRFSDLNKVQVKEIGDGNLNFVYLIQESGKPDSDLIIKQAVPFLRCVGEDSLLSIDRMKFEIRSLLHFSKYAPQHIPSIVKADEDMALVAMQYLGNHITARKALIRGDQLPFLVDHITSFMAESLFKTSSLYMTSHEKRDLMQKFNLNKDLCKITEDFVFTLPFTENKHPALTDEVKLRIIELKYLFMNSTEALVHGDLHTGSLMVNDKETYVIDSEFAFFGPIGFDVGLFMANLSFAWARHEAEGNKDYAAKLKSSVAQTWKDFERKFLDIWTDSDTTGKALSPESFVSPKTLTQYKQSFMERLRKESVGFACCELLRRILGIAKVEDIESIADKQIYLSTRDALIRIACSVLQDYQEMNSVEEFTNYLNIKNQLSKAV